MRKALLFSTIALLNAPAMAQGLPIKPGLWETTVTINSVDMPNAPPAVAQMMRGHTTKVKHCTTPEEAAQGPQEMLKSAKECRFTRYALMGGHFSSEMVCTQHGATVTARSSGSYSPVTFDATGSTDMSGPQHMRMTTTISGHRVGDCH